MKRRDARIHQPFSFLVGYGSFIHCQIGPLDLPWRSSRGTAMRTRIMPMLSILLVAGCAAANTATPDDRRAVVAGPGNAFVSSADATQSTLNEAAKTTLKHGYRYFTILGSPNLSQQAAYTTPAAAGPYAKGGTVIYMYQKGEALPAGPNLWDAHSVLSATELPATTASSAATAAPAKRAGAATRAVAEEASAAPKKYCLLPSGGVAIVTEKDCTRQGGKYSL
jgi:hypothetical protein